MAGNGRRELAIAHLIAGESIKDTAHLSGVGERTLSRWVKEPKFSEALRQAQSEIVSKASRRLMKEIEGSIDTLVELRGEGYDFSPGIRLRASQTLLALAMQYHEMSSFEDRLSKLERILML